MNNMPNCLNDDHKQELYKLMASNLPALRAKAGLSQDELADRLGFARATISAIESKRRNMQWSTFTTIALFFSKDEEIQQLMVIMGIWNDEVNKVLNVTFERENISEQKRVLMKNLTTTLPALRAKLGISQIELAEKIGVTQQTLIDIESEKREMTWMIFVALTLLFMQNKEAKTLLPAVDIYTDELKQIFSFNRENADGEVK